MTNKNEELQERCAERVLAETNVDSINYSAIDIIIQETKDSMGSVEGVEEVKKYVDYLRLTPGAIDDHDEIFELLEVISKSLGDIKSIQSQPPKSEPVDVKKLVEPLDGIINGIKHYMAYGGRVTESDLLMWKTHIKRTKQLLSQSPPKVEPVDVITFNKSIVIDRKEVVKKLINLKRHDRFSFELKDGSFFHNKIFIAISGCVCKCKLLYNNDDGSSGEIDNVEDVEYVVKHILSQSPHQTKEQDDLLKCVHGNDAIICAIVDNDVEGYRGKEYEHIPCGCKTRFRTETKEQ